MLNILVNAYAVSPNWGSEQGMGWNWVVNLAKHCHLDVITEGEWRTEIEEALKNLPQGENLYFHYLPVSDKVRRMCWNQGDWRFYWYYALWQKRALKKAEEIIRSKKIDVIHQLNMIGFREPGYLWKIKGVPFVWGPVGGMELMPLNYLSGAPFKQKIFNSLKNGINAYQYKHSSRVQKAIKKSDAIISAVKGVQDVLKTVYNKPSILLNETGAESNTALQRKTSNSEQPLKILWVGKFDFRKQLPLALKSVAAMNKSNIEFHICGTGSDKVVNEMKEIAEVRGIQNLCQWHGNVEHDKILGMMADSDLFFFTSIMEATSTVVLEAISVGLPILCFNTCGFGPIVKSFAGITINFSTPTQSVADFAIQLNRVYDNRNILNDLSQKIVENRETLTWDYKARRTVEVYQQLTSKTPIQS